MLSARAVLPVLLVPVAFGAGLLLAGGDEPQADAESAAPSIERIDVADRAVDIPGVTAVRVPGLRAEPKRERADSPNLGTSSPVIEQTEPSTGTATPTAPTPPAGGSGSPSTSGSQSTPKNEGGTSGSAEEGSTGS